MGTLFHSALHSIQWKCSRDQQPCLCCCSGSYVWSAISVNSSYNRAWVKPESTPQGIPVCRFSLRQTAWFKTRKEKWQERQRQGDRFQGNALLFFQALFVLPERPAFEGYLYWFISIDPCESKTQIRRWACTNVTPGTSTGSQPQTGCPGSNTTEHLTAKFDASLPPSKNYYTT